MSGPVGVLLFLFANFENGLSGADLIIYWGMLLLGIGTVLLVIEAITLYGQRRNYGVSGNFDAGAKHTMPAAGVSFNTSILIRKVTFIFTLALLSLHTVSACAQTYHLRSVNQTKPFGLQHYI